MLKLCKNCKGAISVFLTLILLPTFIFGGVLVDGSRILGAKNLISGAGDLAMNAALSNYHEELNKTYGLLAMAKTAEEINSIMKDFFAVTLNANGISQKDFNKALVYLELTNDDFHVSNIAGTEIYETDVLKQEILEYMKYRAPVTLLNRAITDKLSNLENMEKEKKAADGKIKFESELDDMQELFDQIKELTDRQEEIYKGIKEEAGLNNMLNRSKASYDEITMLAVAYRRMINCSDTTGGDMESLMRKMVDLSCDVGHISASNAANIIEMIIVKNSMTGKNKNDLLEGLDKDSDRYTEMQELISDYDAADETREEGIKNTEKQLDGLVLTVYMEMSTQRELAAEGENNCKQIKEKVKEIKAKFKNLHNKYETWKEAVDNLPEGESKKSYQENIDQVSGFFKAEGVIGDFEAKIENNDAFYNKVWTQLDNITFTGLSLDKDITGKECFLGEADYGSIISADQITSCGKDFMVNYFDIGSMELNSVNIDISNDEFVKQLKEFYCKENETNKTESENEAEEWDNKLNDSLGRLNDLLLTTDIDKLNVDAIGSGNLPSNWLGIRKSTEDDAKNTINVNGGLKNKGNRKKISDSGSNNLNKDNSSITEMSSLAEKVARGGEQLAEPLMLTEYVMGMFSHNTSNKDTKGKEIKAESISRDDLGDNAIYRAEIEYILWGNPETRDNVGKTKAIIFASNLVFNMSFAFTNSQIKTDALIIANLFPVGPLARTVIKCALQSMVAMIETTRNLLDIMEGKSVPLVKNNRTWDTWIYTIGGTKSDNANGFTYEDYLWILVCANMFIPAQQIALLARTADCVELNMTNSKSKEENTLYDMYTMVDLETSVSIDTFFLQKLNGAGYNVQAVDDETFKIRYYGIQGY